MLVAEDMTPRILVLMLLVSFSGCVGGAVWGGGPKSDDESPRGDAGSSPDESDPRPGVIEAMLVYDGERRFAGADFYLFEVGAEGDPCPDADSEAPSAAITVVSLADGRADIARFEDLQPGSHLVVGAAALDETGVVSAWGCSPTVHVAEGLIEVEVPVIEIPRSLEGTWDLESHLRAIEGVPLGTRLAFGVLDEMTDDANDPATFLLDLLIAQFIEDDTYRMALGWVRQSAGIDRGLNERIRDWAPDLLFDAAAAGGDLVRALDDLRVDSRIDVDAPDEQGVSGAEHELLDLVFEVDDRVTRFSIADDVRIRDTTTRAVTVGLVDGGRVEIGRHEFEVGLGTLALFALHEVVLPRLDGSPRTLGELLSMLVDCREVGDWLSVETGIGSDEDWQDACVNGLDAIGAYLERQILAQDEQLSILALEGHADIGAKVVPRELQDGHWEVSWNGAAGTLPFGGAFEAERIGWARPRDAE